VIAGKYRIERTLGEGGMGVVLEATHVVLGQRVAVKLLHVELAAAPENKARFLREARIAAQLPPDHIARVSDVGETEGGEPYLVMELLTGRDLEGELSARGPLPVGAAVDLVLQACEGVAEAHAVGLIHRDLKPANLFLASRRGEPPVVKVLDFGLSKAFDDRTGAALTQTATNFGTPAYMSPEQIRSAKYAEPRSDQHALGMILYEALTGRPPYQAESLTGLAVVISTAPPPSARAARPEVPAGVDAAIRRALAKAPADRFPSLAELAAAIAPFGGPQASAASARIAAILAPKLPASALSSPPASRRAGDAKAHAPAGQGAAFVAPSNTHSPTTSDPRYPAALRRRRPLIAAVAAGALAVAAAGIFALTRGSGDGASEGAPTATPEPPATAGEPTIVPSATAEPPPPPTASASATAAPSVTATPSRPEKKPPVNAGGTAKPGTQKSPREVFGRGR
jgi:serine/threonine-protein kinase